MIKPRWREGVEKGRVLLLELIVDAVFAAAKGEFEIGVDEVLLGVNGVLNNRCERFYQDCIGELRLLRVDDSALRKSGWGFPRRWSAGRGRRYRREP